ncbi:MAG: lactate utilization protein B [Planctomycetia bacterium]|nr:lactate utilization protein B [Planctomycetia bacterium]
MSATTNALSGAEFWIDKTKELAEPDKTASPALALTAEQSSQASLTLCWGIEQWPLWRQAAKEIKDYALARLDESLVQFEANLTRKGVRVFWAKDAEEANQIVLQIAKENNVRTVVKAKSMASEEIALNRALQANGIRALETDLGEYIVQLLGQRPTHIVTPATHLSAEEIGRKFEEKLGVPYTAEHEKLTMIAHDKLRQEFVNADMGISGANFGIADTGSLCLVENEGNIGLSTTAPRIHVALIGIEKVLPSIKYIPLFLNMLPRMGTGQKLTSYTHLFNGPTQGRQMNVVLIDNGRTNALASQKNRGVLRCIRCGVCMTHCPVYRQVGGWAYGWVYPGPLGAVLTPQLLGVQTAGKLPFASSLCGACSQICPVKVDLAHQLVRLRAQAIEARPKSPAYSCWDSLLWKSYAFFMASPARYKFMMACLKFSVCASKLLPRQLHPWLLGRWTRGREVPRAHGTFRDWWQKNHN